GLFLGVKHFCPNLFLLTLYFIEKFFKGDFSAPYITYAMLGFPKNHEDRIFLLYYFMKGLLKCFLKKLSVRVRSVRSVIGSNSPFQP
ncbi:hypothetical protein ABE905_13525, partial [Enterococcus durans]|uniref:hypothetical protein n=1 Tax=Enterococcus durans TaxID=53345 RepID=UPI003D6A75C5